MKLLQGTYRKDRAPANEPQPEPEVPNCPTWLGREGKREWRRVVKHLEGLNMLTQLDRTMLAAYCQAYDDWYRHTKYIQEHGDWNEYGSGHTQQHPAAILKEKALKRIEKFGSKFGLSPSDRAGLSVPETKDVNSNPFAQLGS